MLRRYVEQIMNLYNFINGILIVNNKGIIEYFVNCRKEVDLLTSEEVLGKHLLDIYPCLDKESSTIFETLKTGKPVFNKFQKIITYKKNDVFNAVNTTLPIRDKNNKVIGAVNVFNYVESKYEKEHIKLSLKNNYSKKNEDLYSLDDIIAESESMKKIKEKIKHISKTDSSVLIYGETGTGKELVAQAIHTESDRYGEPFVWQNCAAIPSSLLEGILFGTSKGSYTGAENRKGLFELANHGTLFLDEINSMEISIQAKILRAIEEKKIRRLGSEKTIDLDVRIISSVNENPMVSLEKNNIRHDLYYRLAPVRIDIPILKERKNEVIVLTNHFIDYFNHKMDKNIIGLTEEVEKIFLNYNWPGNVRELKNVIEGAFNLSGGKFIKKSDLPDFILENRDETEFDEIINSQDLPLDEKLKYIEKKLIKRALSNTKSQVEASNELKISRQLLRYKIEKYNL